LQEAGLISMRRGHITILDREGLEGRACECYGIVKQEFRRLLLASAAEKEGTQRPSAATTMSLYRSREPEYQAVAYSGR
jgi:hypothetical protein